MADDDAVAVRVIWIDLDETPIFSASQFVGQVDHDQLVISIGSQSPPVIMGDTVEDRRQAAESIGFVPIRVVSRFAITRQRLGELINVLTTTAENYDKARGEGG